jgi:hypothetical protein
VLDEDQSQDLRLVREAAAQQSQPSLQVVLDIWQLKALVRHVISPH